ncbi:phage terminase small subunit P27 family [Xylophilus rhododendri]|uniref:Phage terminase small subunit P27 family n=1 Tax=Xylophilus rhododendri TaxID=2697032 RepID=A0A857J5U1_9BURK|nr:phage terminase small subunit P27 family [Xylophilus rhododendri]QHI99354.1 phage terminase small subunit P27 family [Xylophilus rhododendri]
MGARGPAPKPGELKALEGGRGHRALNLDTTFRPEVGLPDAPRWLTPEAKKAWKRLGTELLYYNLISKVDRDAFAMLCQTIGRLEIVERSIMGRMGRLLEQDKDAAEALMDSTPNGLKVQAAIYQVLNKEQEKLHRMLAEFGLTPAQRARVTTAIRAQLQLIDGGGAPAVTPSGAPTGFADFR